jgi:hypothetical protein
MDILRFRNSNLLKTAHSKTAPDRAKISVIYFTF